jgi:hypothetical protein
MLHISMAGVKLKRNTVSLSRHMSDELTRHMSDFVFWVICFRQEARDAVKSDIDGGDTDGAI